ncbi:uncharacterized protein LOC120662520 [Panicum virgatum]|uniref:uncharacterized protein LOC120662520 n=1 Tax=Panicum virgatum TaxID=38727 RepID=UPI0019D56D26|nr:uncharacterized protein LOC120662520 [Panicum virgatum]
MVNVINAISAGSNEPVHEAKRQRKEYLRTVSHVWEGKHFRTPWSHVPITFSKADLRLQHYPHNDPLVIRANIGKNSMHFAGNDLGRILVDNGSFTDIITWQCFIKMGLMKQSLHKFEYTLISFGGNKIETLGKIELKVTFGEGNTQRTKLITFVVVDINYLAALGQVVPPRSPESPCADLVTEFRLVPPPVLAVVTSALRSRPPRALGVICEVQYPDWLANVVMVSKKNGSWRMRINFTTLNKFCPKDEYLLPRIDTLVDAAVGSEMLSMLDCFLGYYQIFMKKTDEEKTSFTTPFGPYCYIRMPEGLRTAGCTFNITIGVVLGTQLDRNISAYVDDVVVWIKKREDHISDLRETFANLRKHGLKLNPEKCVFSVRRGKVLGFMITERSIKANLVKIEAIRRM